MIYFDINSITDLHSYFDYEKPVHPLITVIDFTNVDQSKPKPRAFYRMNLYSASCKKFEVINDEERTLTIFQKVQ